jgi:phosphoribosylanthranilate isomerase
MAVRVKICGVTDLRDALAAAEAGASAIGFNFYRRSPRYVSPEVAACIAAELPAAVCRVGVFVNEPRASMTSIACQVGLNAIQLHGDESPEECARWDRKVIKAIRLRDAAAVAAAGSYAVDFILADAYVEGTPGGSGRRVDLDLLAQLNTMRLIVAGGLDPGNVTEVVRRIRPFGVDVASGVERAPGRKDRTLMRRFIENAVAA